MVAKALMVAGETDEVIDTQCGSAENVALDSDAVPVPTDHLHDRIKTHLFQYKGRGKTAHPHDACLIIGDVDGVDIPFQKGAFFSYNLRISATWRTTLAGYSESTACENFF